MDYTTDRPDTHTKEVSSTPIVNCVAYREGKRLGNIELEGISQTLQQPNQFVWLGLHEPGKEMLSKVQKELGLHELAVEDALNSHQRPKIEAYGDTLFIVMRTAQMKGHLIDLGETHFFLGNNFIISVRHGSTIAYTDVRARCESTPQLLQRGPGFALYALMDAIVDRYFPVIDALEQELAELEDKIFDEDLRRETTAQIYQLKRQFLDLKRAVGPLIDVCNRLMRFDFKLIDDEARPYFRDVYDHTIRINEMVDNARELLATALEANLSLISISQNEVSRKFASWAAIIGVPTMIAGIYGMNFTFMPELNWKFGYPLIVGVTFGICLSLYIKFKRSGWL